MQNESRTLWISLGAGLLAAFLLYSYTQEQKATLEKKALSLKEVVVATADIKEMQTIDESMVNVIQVPEDYAQPLHTGNIKDVLGQVAAAPIMKNEQVLQSKLKSPGAETGLSLQVAPDRRAFSLPIDDIRAVARLIRPGDRVDLIANVTAGKGATARTETLMFIQDVVVLATGLSIQNNLPRVFETDPNSKQVSGTSLTGDSKYNTITIEVTPKQSQDLAHLLFTSPSSIYLSLRNPSDRKQDPRLPSSNSDAMLGRPLIPAEPFGGASSPSSVTPRPGGR